MSPTTASRLRRFAGFVLAGTIGAVAVASGAFAADLRPDPSPPSVQPQPDAVPSARAPAASSPRVTAPAPVRRATITPRRTTVVRVVTVPAPAVAAPRPQPAAPLPKPAAKRQVVPAPKAAPKPSPRRVAGEPRQAIAQAVAIAGVDRVPLLLAAAALAAFALGSSGVAVAIGRELEA